MRMREVQKTQSHAINAARRCISFEKYPTDHIFHSIEERSRAQLGPLTHLKKVVSGRFFKGIKSQLQIAALEI